MSNIHLKPRFRPWPPRRGRSLLLTVGGATFSSASGLVLFRLRPRDNRQKLKISDKQN